MNSGRITAFFVLHAQKQNDLGELASPEVLPNQLHFSNSPKIGSRFHLASSTVF